MAFVDIRAAFDSVRHELLIPMLENFISKNLLKQVDPKWSRIITRIIATQYSHSTIAFANKIFRSTQGVV